MSKVRDDLWTMTAIRQANADAGRHFFEPETLRFFRSRIVSQSPHQGPGGIYFVTSERFVLSSGPAKPRRYTVREFNPETGDIVTHGRFQQYKSAQKAREAAERAASGRCATFKLAQRPRRTLVMTAAPAQSCAKRTRRPRVPRAG
jgi:hypothetical protein